MSALPEFVELEIIPIPPETLESTQEKLITEIRMALQDAGRQDLLESGDIRVEIEKTFPVDLIQAAVQLLVTLVGGASLEIFKTIILPKLKTRFNVEVKPQRK